MVVAAVAMVAAAVAVVVAAVQADRPHYASQQVTRYEGMTISATSYPWPGHTFPAMGTRIKVWIDTDPDNAAQPFAEVEALFRSTEKALSRFDPASELSQLNAHPESWVTVSKVLWEVLSLAVQYAEETSGLFDPTMLHAVQAAGYSETFSAIRTGGEGRPQGSAGPAGRWHEVRLDPASRAVWLPAGVGIDLGGIAKGYTAQWAARLADLWGPTLIDAGGDLVATEAPRGLDGWPVSILTPRINGQESTTPLVLLTLRDEAMATSGIDHRRWQVAGKQAHHIIDPRTGQPAETNVLTVTVIAPGGAEAEAWAKVALIGGTDGLDELAEYGLPALVVDAAHTVHPNSRMEPRIAVMERGG
jgi:thiamine biosynthesis lipoprotein